MQEICTLRSKWRGLETWHGRDIVALADERASNREHQLRPTPARQSSTLQIEHRLFCHLTQNWRGKPLRTFETIVDLIGNTRTAAGLRVTATLDERTYPTGETVTHAQMRALSLKRDDFHGEWNYELQPRTTAHKVRGSQSLKLPTTKLAS